LVANYVLIDFENIQPNNLEILKSLQFKLLIFVGSNQKKISFEMVEIIQSFGSNAEYIKIDGNGQNALDFHIAFYIGKMSSLEKDPYFHIISKDTGFDPLIRHLKLKKIKVQRVKDVSEIPIIKNMTTKTISENLIKKEIIPKIAENKITPIKKAISKNSNTDENINKIIKYLVQKVGKPSTKKTLVNSINDLFQKKLTEKEIENLLDEIIKREYISMDNTKVNYSLPGK
jgi:hypothetical protein